MMGIVEGTIPVAGHTGSNRIWTAGIVTLADFEGYKAEQKRTLLVLKQLIEGGGYTIGLLCLPHWRSQFCTVCSTSHLIVIIVWLDLWS